MEDGQQSTVSAEPQETQSNNEQSTNETGVEATKAQTFKFVEVAEAVAVEFSQDNDQPDGVEFSQASEQPAGDVMLQEEVQVSTGQDIHEDEVSSASQVVVSDPNLVESNDQVQPDMISSANDQEMGLAVAILELIGSQPHITVNTPGSSQEQADQTTEFVDVPVKANDQEMGLAVAILELIGSQPHITVNTPGSSQADQTTEFVDVPVKDGANQGEHEELQSVGDITGDGAYPVSITVIPDDVHIKAKSASSTELSASALTSELSATVIEDNTTDRVGEEIKHNNGDEQNDGEGGSKKKLWKIKLQKRKASTDLGKEDKSSKKQKKINEIGKEEKASTSDKPQSKDKEMELEQDTSDGKKFLCTLCSATFNRKDNLKVHARKKHDAEVLDDTNTERTKCLNPQCDKTFYHKTQMLRHMEQEHGLEIQKKEMEFKSLEEFKKWKVEEETNKYVFFSSYRGPAATKSGKSSHLYFKCQKDGPNRPHRKLGEPGRKTTRRNKKGSVKTGLLCPARMICKVDGKSGKVNLTYIFSHSHPITSSDTQFQPVPDPLKKEIMEKLALGTPVKQVYKDLRKVTHEQTPKSASETAVQAVHHITHRTLELLKHRVDMSRRLHHDESISILLLVEKLKAETFNPVLLYKPQGSVAVVGDESLMHLPFADDLGVLALQTEEQMKVLKHNTSKVIYVDTTYTVNPTEHKLISLVVPDTSQQGYPVAHLIANRIDEHLLYYFVKAIKERCEGFQPSVVLTDEDNTGYGVFQAVYPGVSFTHLLSKWHVHCSWLKRMGKELQNSTLRQEIYHCLVTMMEESNQSKFNEMASNFVNYYASKCQTFAEYFVEMYRARPELWASSYRGKDLPNDVLHMNLYHSNMRAFFQQKRKASKRLDSLVNCLLDMDKDAAWKRVKRVFEEGGSDDTSGLSHHEKGMAVAAEQVEDAGEQDTWMVPSYDQQGVKHKVKKLFNICLDDHCHHKCLELCCFALCHHLYECSCYDEVNICQHIHRVHSIRVAQLQVPQSIQCPPAADLGAYVEIHYMDEDENVGVATQNVQTSEVTGEVTAATEAEVIAAAAETAGEGNNDQVGTLQTRLQHLVTLLGTRQVDDILLTHVTGTVDQLISTCEAASNVPATQT